MKLTEKPGLRRVLSPSALAVLPVMVLALACDQPTPVREAPVNGSGPASKAAVQPVKPRTPPNVTVRIAKVKENWKDRQQTYQLVLANHGDEPVLVHALVYATNESVTPPRRAISPPTAFDWFALANSQDGKLTVADIERAWKLSGFGSARGQSLKKTWDVKLEPEATAVVDCAHDLEEVAKHPQWKGKRLPQAGYTQYHVWLFTADGHCFFEGAVPAFGDSPEIKNSRGAAPEAKAAPEEPKPEAKAAETRPVDPKVEAEAAKALRLANYYLDRERLPDAKAQLKLILQKYRDTEAARTAQKLLKDLERSKP